MTNETKNLIRKIADSRAFNIFGFSLAGLSLLSVIGVISLNCYQNKKAENLYRQTLFQNADLNKDGFISDIEKSNFDSQLFKGKNVYFEGGVLKYNNGNSVSAIEIIQWINNNNKIK